MKNIGVLALLLAVLAAIAALGMGTGLGMMGPGMMWGYGAPTSVAAGGWGWATAMALGWLTMVAFLGAVVVGVIFFARWVAGATEQPGRGSEAELPLAILRRRYAAGEIDEATYERMKRELAA